VIQRTPLPAAPPGAPQWALDNAGAPGTIGSDVHGLAAWTITKGGDEIRVAVLDEGVDTSHPFLAPAVVAEADFVDQNDTAMPDGDDAHGTACAGIVASRNRDVSGLAPRVSLVAARIAKSDAQGFWIFDDFATADAIDWCWDDAKADVLSNSWGGGPPAPVITLAFERARSDGRGGRGAVIVVAAGNDQRPVDFPGNLEGVVTVGASNQWDKRKTRTSQDGENWWGSNYGPGLDLMAPGVAIATTDIKGPRGYTGSRTTDRFNGTSSSTPFVAAAAALMLSANPELTEARASELLRQTVDPLTKSRKWNQNTGYGRLNAYTAVRAARRG
jgi:subtilisin family serine protease